MIVSLHDATTTTTTIYLYYTVLLLLFLEQGIVVEFNCENGSLHDISTLGCCVRSARSSDVEKQGLASGITLYTTILSYTSPAQVVIGMGKRD